MTEREKAIELANKILDNASRDPDSDLSMMARQFVRSQELIALVRLELAQLVVDRLKQDWMPAVSNGNLADSECPQRAFD
jgi:hypothetical protein